MARTIKAIDIWYDWQKPSYAAVPYLQAMQSLASMQDVYGCDDARDIVLRFLANAATYRGATARALKAELRAMLAEARQDA